MARDVDDLAVALGAHRGRRGLDAVEGAGHVGLHHLAPRLGGEPPQRAVVRDAGVVDEAVDAAEPLLDLGHEALDFVVVADVAARRVDADAERFDRRLGQQRLGGDVAPGHFHEVEGDAGAALGEVEADGAPQPRRSTRDDDHSARQILPGALQLGTLLHDRRPGGGRRLPRGQCPRIWCQGIRTYVRV